MSAYLARLVSGGAYRSIRDAAKQLASHLPRFIYDKARKAEEFSRSFITGGTMFEELGFYYVGPIDGHNLDHLLPVLMNVRDKDDGPVLVHVVTQKGKGYAPAEASDDKYHGVNKFDVATGQQIKPKANAPTYTSVFGKSARSPRPSTTTRSSPSPRRCRRGTGLDIFGKAFPRAHLRRRDRRAARRHFRGGSRRRGL